MSTNLEFNNCKTPKTLIIADPYYLEGKMTSRIEEIIFQEKNIPSNFETKIIFKPYIDDTYGEIGTSILICIAPPIKTKDGHKLVDVYAQEKCLSKMDVENKELGCDTAQFTIYTDSDYHNFSTLSDGYYGDVSIITMQSKGKSVNCGYIINLFFNDDAFNDSVIEKIKSLFI